MKLFAPLAPSSSRARSVPSSRERAAFQDFVDWFSFQGSQYVLGTLPGSNPRFPDPTFSSYVQRVHRENGPISAAVTARALLISQVRFVWRNNRLSPTPGRLFGDRRLAPLERPGAMTRSEMLHRMELDASYSGNSYLVPNPDGGFRRLRPDYVSFFLGSDSDPTWEGDQLSLPADAKVTALVYAPPNGRVEAFTPDEVVHWMPEPDPIDWWRGASWVTSLLAELAIDGQVTTHQTKFFQNAATPNLVFIMDPAKTPQQVQEYADVVNARHAGAMNAHKNMFLGGGTDAKVVGASLDNLSLKDVSGGFESRVAARSRVPAVVLGIREGMAGSALNSGNYQQTRRLWADGWFSPTVQNLCGAFERVIPPPTDAELSHDPAEVMFLQEDQQDAANIRAQDAMTIRQLVDAGFSADAVVEFVRHGGDLARLIGAHSGLFSVQLQEPGAAGSSGQE